MTEGNSYLTALQNELEAHNRRYEALEKRIALIKANNGYTEKTEFEKNEIELTIMETGSQMAAMKKIITNRELYFKEYLKQWVKDFEECDSKFDSVLETAKELGKKKPNVQARLDKIVWENVDKMPEVKVTLYKDLKQLIIN